MIGINYCFHLAYSDRRRKLLGKTVTYLIKIDEKFNERIGKKCWKKVWFSVRNATKANVKIVFQLIPQKVQSFQKTYKNRMFESWSISWSSGLSNKIKLIDCVDPNLPPEKRTFSKPAVTRNPRMLHYPLPLTHAWTLWLEYSSYHAPHIAHQYSDHLNVERNMQKKLFAMWIFDDIKYLRLYAHENLPDMIDDNVTLNHSH